MLTEIRWFLLFLQIEVDSPYNTNITIQTVDHRLDALVEYVDWAVVVFVLIGGSSWLVIESL